MNTFRERSYPQSSWVVLGLSNFFHEIEFLVESLGGTVTQLMLNQEPDATLLADIPDSIERCSVDTFSGTANYAVWGFTSPQKQEFFAQVEKHKLVFPPVIHPSVVLPSSVQLSEGVIIQPGVTIGTRSAIGSFAILNRSSSVGHDTVIGAYTHVGPGAVVSGKVDVGERDFLGAGSVVIDRVTVGNDITVGAGAVVTKNLSEAGTYVGVPARLLVPKVG